MEDREKETTTTTTLSDNQQPEEIERDLVFVDSTGQETSPSPTKAQNGSPLLQPANPRPSSPRNLIDEAHSRLLLHNEELSSEEDNVAPAPTLVDTAEIESSLPIAAVATLMSQLDLDVVEECGPDEAFEAEAPPSYELPQPTSPLLPDPTLDSRDKLPFYQQPIPCWKLGLVLVVTLAMFGATLYGQSRAYEHEVTKWKTAFHDAEIQLLQERKLREMQTEAEHANYIAALREKHLLELREYPIVKTIRSEVWHASEVADKWVAWGAKKWVETCDTVNHVVQHLGSVVLNKE